MSNQKSGCLDWPTTRKVEFYPENLGKDCLRIPVEGKVIGKGVGKENSRSR